MVARTSHHTDADTDAGHWAWLIGRARCAHAHAHACTHQAAAPEPAEARGSARPHAAEKRTSKPYVADYTEFSSEAEVNRNRAALQAENELLRRCMQDRSKPAAFSSYIRANTTF